MTATDPQSSPDPLPSESATHHRLCAEDARLLDRLVECGFDLSALPDLSVAERARAERIVQQLGLLDAYPVPVEAESSDAGNSLIDATLLRIEREDAARADRMRLDPERATSARRRFRFPDLIAVASIALLATVVLVPLLNWRNARALDFQCENNMRMIAEGIESYTQSFGGTMPMTASLVPDIGSHVANWLSYRNADNLAPLKAGHYCDERCLCCPGDHDPNGCYAYQVNLGERRPGWQNGVRSPVIADRNPVVDLKRNGQVVDSATLNSASHGGRGQNILFSDGAIQFASSPYFTAPERSSEQALDGQRTPVPGSGTRAMPHGASGLDNIWLPFGDWVDALSRTPREGDGPRVDVFLLH
jgi:hypothetical protein